MIDIPWWAWLIGIAVLGAIVVPLKLKVLKRLTKRKPEPEEDEDS